jgi:glucosylceramidase
MSPTKKYRKLVYFNNISMKKIILLASIVFASLFGCSKPEIVVEWVSSSPISKWETKKVTTPISNDIHESTIQIYPDKEQQVIDGFGGCFNELGWEAVQTLTLDDQNKIFESLFDTLKGCDFNIFRMPIGANDYAVDWYSHNETMGDFEMTNFSIKRDKQRLIPYINKAKTYNPNIKIWASPWCPPSWMKTNNNYACKPDVVNDLKEEGKGEEMQTQFIMEQKYLTAYALYFSKFIQAYQKEGIDIYAVHVQNEPNSCQNFPSSVWNPSDLGIFIGDYLGPKFVADSLETEIWLGTIERPQIERVDSVLSNKKASKYVKGVGFQWAGKGAIPEVNKKYPDLKLMQTETECGDGSNDWAAAEHTFELMKHYFNNGANSYMYWNMVLNETGKSQWGWKQNSMITVDTKSNKIAYNPEFYLMKHFSNYIDEGARKIEVSDKNCLAFKNANSIVLIYYNEGKASKKSFKIKDHQFSFELSENSFNTIKVYI